MKYYGEIKKNAHMTIYMNLTSKQSQRPKRSQTKKSIQKWNLYTVKIGKINLSYLL